MGTNWGFSCYLQLEATSCAVKKWNTVNMRHKKVDFWNVNILMERSDLWITCCWLVCRNVDQLGLCGSTVAGWTLHLTLIDATLFFIVSPPSGSEICCKCSLVHQSLFHLDTLKVPVWMTSVNIQHKIQRETQFGHVSK